jgi:hypothetical protein
MSGQLRVNNITDEPGTGAATFPNGVKFADNTTQTTAATAGNYIMRTYNSPATWTKPVGLKAVKVTVVGAGGNGGTGVLNIGTGGGGGGAGYALKYLPVASIPGPVVVTQGTAPSKTSSFGAFVSATGGSNGVNATPAGPAVGGAGGDGSGGDVNAAGADGSGRNGGASALAYSLPAPLSGPTTAGRPYGGGAVGGSSSPGALIGGTGAAGLVIVEEFY